MKPPGPRAQTAKESRGDAAAAVEAVRAPGSDIVDGAATLSEGGHALRPGR
jgi:hypothetical protein